MNTSTMSDPPPISLRAWPSGDPDKNSLSLIISRINHERGSFRTISEDILEEEIRTLKGNEIVTEEHQTVSSANTTQDAKARREEVLTVREEIIKHIERAWNESAHALDFVSAILSRHTPRQAELTMSPFLKQNLPMGSLGAEIFQLPQMSEMEKGRDELVSTGWKLQSLNSTADALLVSASRLEQEIARETKYWGQVLAVKEQGWSLNRLPREKSTLGVRYGFGEAHPDFRDRGLAALRRDEDGNIDLDLGNRSPGNRALRIRVLQEGVPIVSHVRAFEQDIKKMPTVKLLLQARDSLHDEELHQELHREARNYTNQGVRSVDSKILIPYEVDKEIEIDLVSTMDEESHETEGVICKSIALSLRILLSNAHHQNLRQRSQIPPPLKEGKIPRPVYAILRPILENLQHNLQVQQTKGFFDRLSNILSKAHLVLAVKESKSNYYFINQSTNPNQEHLSATENLVRSLTAPLESSIMVFLPTQLTSLKIEIQTGLQPPFFGTEYRCTIIDSAPDSLIAKMPATTRFYYLESLENHVLHLIELDLVLLLLSNQGIGKEWSSTSQYTCQLSRRMKMAEASHKLNISIRKAHLRLNWQRRGSKLKAEGTETWDSSSMNDKGLVETILGVFPNK